MSLPLLLHGLGSVGIFAGRAFVPAFVTALLVRYGPEFPWVGQLGLLPSVRAVPTWFTSDIALVVLGVLAVLELAAERFPEAKQFLDEIHGYLKAGMAALTYMGVLNATDRAAVGRLIEPAGFLDVVPAGFIAAATLAVSRIRGSIVGPLTYADEDDDLGLQRLLRWAGDLWGMAGPVALIVFPVLTITAFGVAIGLLFAIERVVEARGDRLMVPCVQCNQPIHASAVACPHCAHRAESPRAVGLLGRPKAAAADPATLPYDLVAVKRCPTCATRFSRRAVQQTCTACGHHLMSDPAFAESYIRTIDRRVPLACGVGFLFGLIPILGLIPGVIAYRLLIVAPFRRYIPPGRDLLLRWGVRLLILILVGLQWVPVAGALALPVIGLISYLAYRTVYQRLALGATVP